VLDYELFSAQLSVGYPAIRWLPRAILTVTNLKNETTGILGRSTAGQGTDKFYVRPRYTSLRLEVEF
jgi:hypothetical protein